MQASHSAHADACREMRRPRTTVRAPFRHTLDRRMSIAVNGERHVPLSRTRCLRSTYSPRRSHRACLEAGTRQTLFGAGLKDLFLRGTTDHPTLRCLLAASSRIQRKRLALGSVETNTCPSLTFTSNRSVASAGSSINRPLIMS